MTHPASTKISLADQIKCAEREIGMRLAVYPGRVANKKMALAKADHEMAAMRAILTTLQLLQGPTPETRGKVKPLVIYCRKEADRDELIAAIRKAKPGMTEFTLL